MASAPKPILKNPASSAPPAPEPPAFTTPAGKPLTPAAHALALSHAQSLQIRKALEASILESIETLLEFPLTPSSIPLFKHHLRYLQPADYDTLIEERNISELCGYPLCSNQRKKLPGKPSKFVLVDKGKKGMRFVRRAQMERFCSDDCARRGLWIRLQLSEEPAWLRREVVDAVDVDERGIVSGLEQAAGSGEEILLFEEAEAKRQGERDREKAWTKGEEGDIMKLAEELENLGIESGDLLGKDGEEKKGDFDVLERETSGSAVAPSLSEMEVDVEPGMKALSIEGYVPRKGPDDYRDLMNTLRGKKVDNPRFH
ncbi:hypothetical protein RUND412_004496 [Rhizina undulata]